MTQGAALPLRRVLLGFVTDLVLAILAGLTLTTLLSLAWGFFKGIRIASAGGTEQQVGAAMTTPGAVAQIATVLIASSITTALLYAWRRPASAQEIQRSRQRMRQWRTWGVALSVGIGMFVLTSAASALLNWLGIPPRPSNIAVIRAAYEQSPIFVCLFAVLIAPMYEEFLFRRVLFARFWQAGWPVLGICLSGLAFALAHEFPSGGAPLASTLSLIVVYATMGATFAWLYRRTGTIWAAVLAHALNNALALFLLLAFTSS